MKYTKTITTADNQQITLTNYIVGGCYLRILANGVCIGWIQKNDADERPSESRSWEWHSFHGAEWEAVGRTFREADDFSGNTLMSNNRRLAFHEFLKETTNKDNEHIFMPKFAAIAAMPATGSQCGRCKIFLNVAAPEKTLCQSCKTNWGNL